MDPFISVVLHTQREREGEREQGSEGKERNWREGEGEGGGGSRTLPCSKPTLSIVLTVG